MIMRQYIPLHAQDLGASPRVIGMIVAVYGLLPLIGAIPGGLLVDYFGARRVLVAGSLLVSSCAVLLLAFISLLAVGVAQALGGLGIMLTLLATQAFVSRLGKPSDLTANFVWYSTSMALGLVLGPSLGGLLAQIGGFRLNCIVAIAISLGVLPLIYLLQESVGQRHDAGLDPTGQYRLKKMALEISASLSNAKVMFRRPLVRLVLLITMYGIFGLSIRTSFYPVYLDAIGCSLTQIGMLSALQSLVALGVRPFVGHLIDLFGELRLAALAVLVGALGIGITPLLRGFGPLAVAAVLAGVAMTVTQPVSMILMSKATPSEHRGVGLGVRQMSNRGTDLLTPMILGFVVSWVGIGNFFFVAAAFLLVGSFSLFWFQATISADQFAPGHSEVR